MTTGWNGRRRIASGSDHDRGRITGVSQSGDDWPLEEVELSDDAQVPHDINDHDLAWEEDEEEVDLRYALPDIYPPSWSPDNCGIPALLRADVSNLAFWQRTFRIAEIVGDPARLREAEARITETWEFINSVTHSGTARTGVPLTPAMRMTMVDRVLEDQDEFHGPGTRPAPARPLRRRD